MTDHPVGLTPAEEPPGENEPPGEKALIAEPEAPTPEPGKTAGQPVNSPRPTSLWAIMRRGTTSPSPMTLQPAAPPELAPPHAETPLRAVEDEASPVTTPDPPAPSLPTASGKSSASPLRGLWRVMPGSKPPAPAADSDRSHIIASTGESHPETDSAIPAKPPFLSLSRPPSVTTETDDTAVSPPLDGPESRPSTSPESAEPHCHEAALNEQKFRAPSLSHVGGTSLEALRKGVVPGFDPPIVLTPEPLQDVDSETDDATDDSSPLSLPKQSRSSNTWLVRGRWATLAAWLLSPVAILGNVWSELPSAICGFAGLLAACFAITEAERRRGQRPLVVAAGLVMLFATGGIFVGPTLLAPWRQALPSRNLALNEARLRDLGRGVDRLLLAQGAFPPAATFSPLPENRPLLGWMALLLPVLDEGQNLGPLRLEEPYSSPANREITTRVVDGFLTVDGGRSLVAGYGPAHFAAVAGEVLTPEAGLVGTGVFSTSRELVRLDDVADGLSNTLAAGEVAANYAPWASPENYRQVGQSVGGQSLGGTVNLMQWQADSSRETGFSNPPGTGALFLMADGSVRYLTKETSPQILQQLATRAAGD